MISGVVSDQSGEPIAGVHVFAQDASCFFQPNCLQFEGIGNTDTAGEYHVVALRRAEVEGDLEGTTILEPAPPSVTAIIPGEDHPPDGPTVRS